VIRHALSRAQDIKDKKIDTIQHDKAKNVMDVIKDAIKAAPKPSGLTENDEKLMNVILGYSELKDKIAPETELGAWLNNDRKAGPEYRSLMKELFLVDVPKPQQKSFSEQAHPKNIGKRITSEFRSLMERNRVSDISPATKEANNAVDTINLESDTSASKKPSK
jgi:hypothetical protein